MSPRSLSVAVAVLLPAAVACATVTPLAGPGDLLTPATVANFDAWPHETIANTLYAPQGLTLSHPAGGNIPVYDWFSIGRVTPSNPNVLAGVGGANYTFTTAVDALFASPITEVGAFMGNDQGIYDGSFQAYQLSVYDAANTLLGSVTLTANQNTSVDQFVGLRSTTPFVRARFENTDWVTANQGLSVVLDDLTFSSVPEPATATTTLAAASLLALGRRRHTPTPTH